MTKLLLVLVSSFIITATPMREAQNTQAVTQIDAPAPSPLPLKVPEPTISFAAIRHITCGDGTGTGSIIQTDTVLTAAHVVDENATCIDTMTGAIGTVVAKDAESDFALLKFPAKALPERFIRMSCEGFRAGQTYYAYGWMFGEEFVAERLIGTGYTAPVIHTQDGNSLTNLQVVQGVIIPGMSGGPIVDVDGNMVGTNQVTDWDGVTNLGTLGASRSVSDTAFCARPEPAPEPAPKKKK